MYEIGSVPGYPVETGYVDAIVGGVASIVETITGAVTGDPVKIAQAEAAEAQAKLQAMQLQKQVQQPGWIPGVPNWAVVVAGGAALYFLFLRGR